MGYAEKAEAVMRFIQEKFWDDEARLYRGALPPDPTLPPHEYMWGSGVQFTALTAATRRNPETYRPILDGFARGLRRYWDDTPVAGFLDSYNKAPGSGKYYDDNAWLVLGFVEAYEVTGDAAYMGWARETQKFCLSGWDDALGGGIYWFEDHRSKNTCSNGPTAAAALRLFLVGKDLDQLFWAKRIVEWTNRTFQDADGLFWDNLTVDGTLNKTKWTYNSALMIRSNVLLYEATGDEPYLAEARRIADAGLAAWADPETGAIANTARFSHLFCEALLRLHDATGQPGYLEAVRRHAEFGDRYVRCSDGGYHNAWTVEHPADERRELIENASAARLLWELAEYDAA
ncbi:MAG TPA: glycoside hydrolase family 76 protein [Armatimonadota bacterium]|jgi:hypothetical protein